MVKENNLYFVGKAVCSKTCVRDGLVHDSSFVPHCLFNVRMG